MPVNKNALIRYRTIDRCLNNRQRRWTLEDLMAQCSDALYELEGIRRGVSRRTIQLDLEAMRSDKLGYAAPIIVVDKKYYTYEDPRFSIDKAPVNEKDVAQLQEALGLLRQIKGFSQLEELEILVKRLEENIKAKKQHRLPVIQMEANERLRGLEWINPLYQAITAEQVVRLQYQPFRLDEPLHILMHPYFLKSYNRRWYLLGLSHEKRRIVVYALDRVVRVDIEPRVVYLRNQTFNPDIYFKDVIGMTVDLKQEPEQVLFWANADAVPYIETKPLHRSQKSMFDMENGRVFSLFLRVNVELTGVLLEFGNRVAVLRPRALRERIMRLQQESLARYNDPGFNRTFWQLLNQWEREQG